VSTLSRHEKYRPGRYGLPHMGDVITDHRLKAGWTSQEIFAKVCGVDKQSVAYWEGQEYLSEMDRRIFLCKLLKISPALLGLTWRSVLSDDQIPRHIKDAEYRTELLDENCYGLYEDILTFAKTSPQKYNKEVAYSFYKHQQELERTIPYTSSFTQDAWKDLLSRYYQHSAFIAQHHAKDDLAISYANKAVDAATSLEQEDVELVGSAYYKRARIHLIHGDYQLARDDIQETLKKTEKARPSLKGSTYLLAAEINAFYAAQEGKLRTQCRQWQDDAANLLYKKKTESDNTFIVGFSLYAVYHERAKTLMRFALFHTSDDELVERLKDRYIRADASLLQDARSSLSAARKHLGSVQSVRATSHMDYAITEARLLLVEREYEQSAKIAKAALNIAQVANSSKGASDVGTIHTLLNELAPQNPFVCNLGVELGRF
jgi:transcriptional regulator with XRE-family HTH domain